MESSQQLIQTVTVLGLGGISILFDIIGLAISSWATSDFVYLGLWEYCNTFTDECIDIPESLESDSLKATRAMVFLGLFAIAGASIAFALKQFVLKEHDIVNKSAAGLFIFGGLLLEIGIIIFASNDDISDLARQLGITFSYGAGFALVIVAGILAVAAGVLTLIIVQGKIFPSHE